jgi:hypothetical protein
MSRILRVAIPIAAMLACASQAAESQDLTAEITRYFDSYGIFAKITIMDDKLSIVENFADSNQTTQYRLAFSLEVLQSYLQRNKLDLAQLRFNTVTFVTEDNVKGKLIRRDITPIQRDFLDKYFTLPKDKKPDALWKGVWQPKLQQQQSQAAD